MCGLFLVFQNFVNEKILEEYSIKTYENDLYFSQYYKKKVQPDESGYKYVLFRIDVYFTGYLSAVEIDEKGHSDRDLIFMEKIQKALEKKLGCKFIIINTSKESYDADCKASRMQTLFSKFKDRQLKKFKKNIKRTRRQNRTIGRSSHSIKPKCLNWIVKKYCPQNKTQKTRDQN